MGSGAKPKSFAIFGHYSTPGGWKLNFPVEHSNIGKVSKIQKGKITWLKVIVGEGRTCSLYPHVPTALLMVIITIFKVLIYCSQISLLYVNNKSNHRRCSVRKDVFRKFAKFTRKHLCQSLIFNKKNSGTGVFLSILQNF